MNTMLEIVFEDQKMFPIAVTPNPKCENVATAKMFDDI